MFWASYSTRRRVDLMASVSSSIVQAKQRTFWYRCSKFIRKYGVPYAFISPFYILFSIFGVFPIVFSFYLSFQDWDGISSPFYVGIENYYFLLQDPLFWKSLYNTLFIAVVAHVPMLLTALVLAFMVDTIRNRRLQEILRTGYFLPAVTSSVAVAMVFSTLYGTRYGLINWVLTSLGLSPIDWWGGTGAWVKPAIIFLFIWRWLGWNMIIYLAGLQGIDHSLYEAAAIDGASKFQIFIRITVPLLIPVILFTLIQSTIGGITIFDEPYVLVGPSGGTAQSGMTLALYLYNQAFNYASFGYASAVAYAITALILTISLINLKLFGFGRNV